MLLVFIFALLVVSQIVIGLLVFLQSRHNKRADQRLFSVLTVIVALWTVANALLISVDSVAGTPSNLARYDLINRAAFFLAGLLVTGIYLFSLFYPVKGKLGPIQWLLLSLGVALTLLGPTDMLAGTFALGEEGLTYTYGSAAALVAVLALLTVAGMYIRQSHILRHTHDDRLRQQVKTLLAGMTLTIAHSIVFIIMLPAVFGQHLVFFAVGYAAPVYLIASTGYGMLRQGLFDIRSIAVRSLAYILALGAVSVIYSVPLVLLTTYLSDNKISSDTFGALVIMTLVVAFFFQPVRNYFDKLTRRLFYRDYYDSQDVLDRLGATLIATVDLDEIVQKSRSILDDAFKPDFVKYLLIADTPDKEDQRLLRALLRKKDDESLSDESGMGESRALVQELQKIDGALAVRLRTRHEDLGFIIMGYRRSGAAYSLADRRLLNIVADELALGLQNALRFQEIQKFNATLQQKVDDATKKLQRTNERLRIMDQTKDDFISMASHQLRTPLTAIKGYVSMVIEGDGGKLTASQNKMLTLAFLSSQRMVYLISDLLNVSRLKTGKFIIDPIPSNLATVVEEEAAQLTETIKARGLEFTYHKPKHFPVLMFDELKLRQVIMNFLDNAIYYTPSGGHIDVYLVDKPHSIEFTVVDDGIGVPKHEQHHLFTKFYRANNAKRARPDGTGLGIFMAKKVIVSQGGAIIFKSVEGKGSTFGFTFPKAHLLPKKDSKPDKTPQLAAK